MIKAIDNNDKPPELNITDFFSENSPLALAAKFGGRPYEHRPQQEKMALAVEKIFMGSDNLCVEAPTGVGKSFAYLVPAINFALQNEKMVLITTETINLQEQLVEKDLPILKQILDRDFKFALAKGRSNYLCFRRFDMAVAGADSTLLPANVQEEQLTKIIQWAETTDDGSLSSIEFNLEKPLWMSICCEAGNCAGAKCHAFGKCFYWKARRTWDKADILVANHALFLTDLKIKEEDPLDTTLLPPYSGLVFDEAHTMEDSAANHLGLRVTSSELIFFLRKLYNSKRKSGLFMRKGKKMPEARATVSELNSNIKLFFENIRRFMISRIDNPKEKTLRILKPNYVHDNISADFAKLADKIEEISEETEDENIRLELKNQKLKCEYYSDSLYALMNMKLKESVYWIENFGAAGMEKTTLFSAPLNVNEILQNYLFKKEFPVVLTSATLSVNNKMNYYRQRTGFTGKELILDSPFPYETQVEMHIPRMMPEPNNREYNDALIYQIRNFIEHTHGRAFVLFTSYRLMNLCAESLKPFLNSMGIKLFIQGKSGTRSWMLNQFKKDIHSVIFGTSSFWTGVDVPGDSLGNVIITKLPFAVPTHPLTAARVEKIEKDGGRAFMDYSLPEAVLKLKQGTGRLIRSKNDRGIIVILDKRIISKRYGQIFIDSLPKCEIIH